ncbi:uncharacterized protein LOC130708332 isoform X9 [Balaenoptera acutorostrata]|uniref:Uncharacterized protein LOC130708332 isoform X9 n=1 Tax=Balaenoptera acutorostrata TaxID=9767 RepID=A0ABM3TNY1_BALAC|nr:uncharacterized protein LOC130708332 isoform X9 [Balaenoptera acutorostrata]XP_057403794.1 uncharacterized protein LOC130708332 isoform X9 [Balaenoptera acutorostrata]XP_057403795.1 uncharacterized protein LOC130708332 isoform X9 [Balaenoptera acutorostrata]
MASCSLPYSVKIIAETGQVLGLVTGARSRLDSTEHTSALLLSADSSFYTANLEQKGEEVMKRINTLLLILANSEALHGKSGVTGVLEEGHLAIRKFQRDVVTARHTVDPVSFPLAVSRKFLTSSMLQQAARRQQEEGTPFCTLSINGGCLFACWFAFHTEALLCSVFHFKVTKQEN